jgi:DNA-binding response OmpR family regulator
VDDDVSLGRALQRMIRSMDMSCEVMTSGEGIIARLQVLRPALLLLDLHMPEKSGLDTLRELRSHRIAVPTVIMTGVKREGTEQTCLSAGAAEVLAKPVEAHTLARLFDQFGGQRCEG